MLKRIHDHSDGTTNYELAEIEADDWDWYEFYEPANGSPPDLAWKSVTISRAEKIIAEYS